MIASIKPISFLFNLFMPNNSLMVSRNYHLINSIVNTMLARPGGYGSNTHASKNLLCYGTLPITIQLSVPEAMEPFVKFSHITLTVSALSHTKTVNPVEFISTLMPSASSALSVVYTFISIYHLLIFFYFSCIYNESTTTSTTCLTR